MVSMNPLAFVAAKAASIFTSASDDAVIKREVALYEASATAFVDARHSSISPSVSTTPSNPIDGVEISLDNHHIIIPPTNENAPLHFVFVVHGHQGRPTDLSYLNNSIRRIAKEKGKFVDVRSSESCVVGRTQVSFARKKNAEKVRRRKRDRTLRSNSKKSESVFDLFDYGSKIIQSNENDQPKGSLIVHNAACNEGKTHDGIVKGGERLLDEMLSVIRSEVRFRQEPVDVTLSIVGNSLGGLYGRYAIAHLAEILEKDQVNNCYLFDGFIRIHFNVFCSTASPHLGCASFTYIPIPRTAELGVARVLGETGSDL